MDWKITKDAAVAASEFHDDGSPFLYCFERCEGGWRNKSDSEIVCTPTLPIFASLEASRSWAERNEASMNSAYAKREAALAGATGGK